MAVRRLDLVPENESTVSFPHWVKAPTPCKTRTFSMVLTGERHGAIRIEKAFLNRPMRKLRRNGAPGYYMGWADAV